MQTRRAVWTQRVWLAHPPTLHRVQAGEGGGLVERRRARASPAYRLSSTENFSVPLSYKYPAAPPESAHLLPSLAFCLWASFFLFSCLCIACIDTAASAAFDTRDSYSLSETSRSLSS